MRQKRGAKFESLTRYRLDKVRERAKLKQSISRLVTILFSELEKLVSTLHMASVYALLYEFPGAKQLADANLTHLKSLLLDASKSRYGREMATMLRDSARYSIGSVMPAKSLELQHTIRLIRELDAEIDDIEDAIQAIMDEIQSPITTIPEIGTHMGAMILAKIGDFSRFDSPDKILAYAGMSPSTYQSGQLSLSGTYSHMEKRGSRYLTYALYNATKYVCLWDPTFSEIFGQETCRGQALQCCDLSCRQKIGVADLRHGEVPATVSRRCITVQSHIPSQASKRTPVLLYPFWTVLELRPIRSLWT